MTYSHIKSKAARRFERTAFLYTNRSLSGVIAMISLLESLTNPHANPNLQM
jgi:hypothetical protein